MEEGRKQHGFLQWPGEQQAPTSPPRLVLQDYGVQLGETEKPVTEYATLNEFFARRLKPGARPIYLSE